MRHLGGYTWESILEEEVPRTMLSIQFLNRENQENKKNMKKQNERKGKKWQ